MGPNAYNQCLYKKRKSGHIKRYQGCAHTQERPCDDTVRRQLSASQGERSQKKPTWDFPGGAVVKNPPANAGDTGSSSGLGRSHMPRSN